MTTIDLHPEDMLDAARRGTLGPDAEADLRAHLGRCAACRMTLQLPDDLRAEGAVTGADAALLARMVGGAMLDEPRVTEPRLRSAGGMPLRRAAVAIVLLLAGGSAGGAVWAARDTIAKKFEPIIVQLRRGRTHAAAEPAAAPRARHAAAAPVVVETPPALEPAPVVVAPPARPARPRVEARATSSESAEALFADANRARRAGDYALALRRYRDLRHAYPGSREEITARVVVGDLLLAEGSVKDGLSSFDSYLAANPDGTLSEEARVGRALALMRLGRRAEEREAWTQLLRKHPDTVQGARARSRLAELR